MGRFSRFAYTPSYTLTHTLTHTHTHTHRRRESYTHMGKDVHKYSWKGNSSVHISVVK